MSDILSIKSDKDPNIQLHMMYRDDGGIALWVSDGEMPVKKNGKDVMFECFAKRNGGENLGAWVALHRLAEAIDEDNLLDFDE